MNEVARRRGKSKAPGLVREAEALEHIERNGSLLWMPCSGWEAQKLFDKLERDGKIERNVWSGRWHVIKKLPTGDGSVER